MSRTPKSANGSADLTGCDKMDVQKQEVNTMGQRKYTEAKAAANRKWDAENIDKVSISFPKGSKQKIKHAAEVAGYKSISAFLRDLVLENL